MNVKLKFKIRSIVQIATCVGSGHYLFSNPNQWPRSQMFAGIFFASTGECAMWCVGSPPLVGPGHGEVHGDLQRLVLVRDLADLAHREGEVEVHVLVLVLALVRREQEGRLLLVVAGGQTPRQLLRARGAIPHTLGAWTRHVQTLGERRALAWSF